MGRKHRKRVLQYTYKTRMLLQKLHEICRINSMMNRSTIKKYDYHDLERPSGLRHQDTAQKKTKELSVDKMQLGDKKSRRKYRMNKAITYYNDSRPFLS